MRKKMLTMLILFVITLTFSYAYASEDIVTIIGGGDIAPEEIDSGFATKILGAFQWVGYAIGVGILAFLGVKYVLASADEKADLKGAFVKYSIGAGLIIFASTIATIIFNLV